ncbi:uncharacterized protein RSE6_00750 [Rhynchosporium secalis]|uniref:Uncharacterized protein n=1 Tax=Rhynchosporium secalis TaxID=38038 RepID=A0A1E1LW16_RHYSE|nr:uncharacterized protein RSE6_00750 [Rhynchosporium secalis]
MKKPAFTPNIKKPDGTLADTTQGKAKALKVVFFPKPLEADLIDIHNYNYPMRAEKWIEINEWEVCEALREATLDKALGEDSILNRTIQHIDKSRLLPIELQEHDYNSLTEAKEEVLRRT